MKNYITELDASGPDYKGFLPDTPPAHESHQEELT